MGVVVRRAPLLKFLEITTGWDVIAEADVSTQSLVDRWNMARSYHSDHDFAGAGIVCTYFLKACFP